MDGSMIQQSTGLVNYLGEYGFWGVVAILAMVIVHLYRQQSALSKEMRDTIAKYAEEAATVQAKYAEESARLQEQTLAALKRNEEVIERNTEALKRLTKD